MKSFRKIVIAGGRGFLGQRLKEVLLAQDCEVVVFTRQPVPDAHTRYREVLWTGRDPGEWKSELDGADALINLTGKNVNCRFTPENQRAILNSRIEPLEQLAEALRLTTRPPALWIQAAGISIYGDTGAHPCSETSKLLQQQGSMLEHSTFLPEVCQQWEAAFNAAEVPGTRKVLLRISSVLDPASGALRLLGPLTQWGLGGCILPGSQYMSWIHIDDWIQCILWLIQYQEAHGTYNLTAPAPVTNREFMRALRSTLTRPWSPPVPVPALKLGCWLMRTEPVLALTSIRGVPQRLQDEGFIFRHPELPAALQHLYSKKETQT